jgi:hypothetical protein
LGPVLIKDSSTQLKLVYYQTVMYKALNTKTTEGKHKQLIANVALKMPSTKVAWG